MPSGEGPALSKSAAGLLVGVLALGFVLVWLSVPRFLGALDALPARSVLWEIRKDRPVTREQLEGAAAVLENSRRRSGTPAHVLSDLALLELLQFELAEDELAPDAQRLLTESLEALEAGLAKAPAGSNGWARLAYARYMRSGLTEGARDALEMSLLTGGIDLSLLSFRLHLILSEWDALGPEFQHAARGEILALTRHGRRGYDALVEIYLSSGRGEVIDTVLAEAPTQQARFTRRLEARLRID